MKPSESVEYGSRSVLDEPESDAVDLLAAAIEAAREQDEACG